MIHCQQRLLLSILLILSHNIFAEEPKEIISDSVRNRKEDASHLTMDSLKTSVKYYSYKNYDTTQKVSIDNSLVGPMADHYFIDEVTITGSRINSMKHDVPNTTTTIHKGEIEDSHDASVLPLAAEQTPGMFITQRGILGYGVSTGGSGGISMRGLGSGSGRVMVLVNGSPQYMGLMGHPISDIYQSQNIERIEVLRGPSSVIYGSGAMGGVINIITSEDDITKLKQKDNSETNANIGYGSYNTLQSQMSISNRKDKLDSKISGAYNRTDGHRTDMGFKQYSGNGQLTYKMNEHIGVGGDLNILKYNANNPGAEDNLLKDAEQDITRGETSVWIDNTTKHTNGKVKAFYNWGKHLVNDGYKKNGGTPLDYRYHSQDYMSGVNAYQNIFLLEGRTKLTVGADLFRFGGKAWNAYVAGENIGTNKNLADKIEHEEAAYIDLNQEISKWLKAEAGVRFDHHSKAGNEWIPQAGLIVHNSKCWSSPTVKLSVAEGYRNPTLKELYIFKMANEDLEPEKIWNYEIAYSQNPCNNLSYGVNIFYINGDNTITTQMVDGKPLNVNTGKIENKGIEVEGRYGINENWTVNANYSYLNMKYAVLASPEHKLYAGCNFNWKRIKINAGVQYIGGLYTAVGDNEKQEDYVLLNMTADYQVNKWLTIWAKGDNLLNQEYEINAGYPMPKINAMGGIRIKF